MRIPDETNRIAIVGATGTGKTIAELWQLSQRDINIRPWIVFNWKADKNIDGIPGAHFIELDELPIEPGVYIYHPHPQQTDEVEHIMWAVWERGGIGLVIDEGYMVGVRNPAFRAILTQGRSKEIPVIVLSQRPVWMDKFVFSEAEFFQVFRLQNSDDNKAVQKFIPKPKLEKIHPIEGTIPKFYSWYYDAGEDKLSLLGPVPSIDIIYHTFASKLIKVRGTI